MKNDLNISIFSKALYSNWCYARSYQTLFDCGEGCATHLGNFLAGVENIFIGHGHGDHVLGLPAIIGARNAGRGISRNADTMDSNKPLTVFYPGDNYAMRDLIDFVEKRNRGWLRYDLQFVPISPGFTHKLSDKTFIDAVTMNHQKNATTLGYVIYENRTRLKPEFRGQNIPALLKTGVSRDALMETYRANLFGYCLDAYNIIDGDKLEGCEDVIMDCTFINEADRTDPTHFTLDEAKSFCKDARIKNMYAAHQSGRYNYNDVVAANPDIRFISPFKVNDL